MNYRCHLRGRSVIRKRTIKKSRMWSVGSCFFGSLLTLLLLCYINTFWTFPSPSLQLVILLSPQQSGSHDLHLLIIQYLIKIYFWSLKVLKAVYSEHRAFLRSHFRLHALGAQLPVVSSYCASVGVAEHVEWIPYRRKEKTEVEVLWDMRT